MEPHNPSALPVSFNYSSLRAQKARMGRILLRKNAQFLIKILLGLSIVLAGVGIIFYGREMAFVTIPTMLLIMTQLWAHGDLKKLPAKLPEPNETLMLENAVDRRLLGKLKKHNTPQDIWKAVKGTWRQQFFSGRYGMSAEVFDQYLSDQPDDANLVWHRALDLAHKEGQNSITAATVTVALFTTIPRYDEYLAQLHLEPEDLIVGIDWQRHIELVIERLENKDHFGGFARDWAAGYTPILSQLGHNLSNEIQIQGGVLYRETDTHQEAENQLVHVLGASGRPTAALVGEVGTGKTTTVQSMAERLLKQKDVPSQLRYNQVVLLDAPSLLAHINSREALEGAMLRIFAEARAAKNIILFFDEARTFFVDGPGSVDLSNILMPIIESGSLRLVFSFTPSEWQELSTRNPGLTNLMNRVTLKEPDKETTMQVLEDQVLLIEYKHRVHFMYQALLEAYRLAERYVQDGAFPGKAIRLLESATSQAENGLVTEASVQRTIETVQGVKIQKADSSEKERLVNLEDEIHRRMVNQKRAVSVVANALRRSRSGVGNPNKPIGTFLFLGPTGVGKTELSKAISDTYFGGEASIIRVDMNQYIHKEDIDRLIEGAGKTENSLVSQISRAPFSVVLFDEIEKAHPDVVNVFLQLLDEGVMRDTNNRNISFKDAIIIATSNAGADVIREKIAAGQQLEEFEQEFIDDLINKGLFKPEFLNRFDEIVLFRPLEAAELLQIVDIMLAGVNKTLARQKVSVVLTDAAKHWLVEHGNDPRMGARPLRRTVQRTVENVVAQKLLKDEVASGGTVNLDVADLEQAAS